MGRIPMKEDAQDVAVKRRLWEATAKELLHFANRCAEEHVVGQRYPRGQQAVTAAAKRKGYPILLVRALGSLIRRGKIDAPEVTLMLLRYKDDIGLKVKG